MNERMRINNRLQLDGVEVGMGYPSCRRATIKTYSLQVRLASSAVSSLAIFFWPSSPTGWRRPSCKMCVTQPQA